MSTTSVDINVHLADDANVEAELHHRAGSEPYVTMRFAQIAVFVRNPDQLADLATAADRAATDLRGRLSRSQAAQGTP